MVIDTDHLVNQIHAEVEGVAETGFPMDVFPERIQKIIYDLVTYENYNLEYTASIILSAYFISPSVRMTASCFPRHTRNMSCTNSSRS